MTDKQPEALRLADACQGIGECDDWPQLLDAAAELRRLHAENALLHYTLTAYVGVSESLEVEQTENDLLESRCDELLAALKQLAMWLPIMTEMAGMDAHKTQVEFSEFSDYPGLKPEIISIASSMIAAKDAIAKAEGEKQ